MCKTFFANLVTYTPLTTVTISNIEIDYTLGGGIDYISGPYTVKIPTNKKMVPFSILITDDKKKEKDETFHLAIDQYSLPTDVIVGSSNTAMITIVDTTKCKIMLLCSYILQ